MKAQPKPLYIVIAFLNLAVVACTCGPLSQIREIQTTAQAGIATAQGLATDVGDLAPTINAAMTEAAEAAPGLDLTTTAAVATADAAAGFADGQVPLDENAQWAIAASATSQYGDDAWSATQAVGPANTFACGDQTTAWASGSSNEIATLTLDFASPVIPNAIIIYETYSPGAVVRVEVFDLNGNPTTVYTATPIENPVCPNILTIAVSGVTTTVNRVAITVDQTSHSSWNEIDAVQLLGTP
jgi:hypothetical protein